MARSVVKTTGKNYFINGGMDFSQRIGTSGYPTTSTPVYYFDRWQSWYGNNGSTPQISINTQSPIPSLAPHCMTQFFTADTSASEIWLRQFVESTNAQEMGSELLNLSFWVNSNSASSVVVNFYTMTSPDSPGAATLEQTVTKTFAADSVWHLVTVEGIALSSTAKGVSVEMKFTNFTITGSSQPISMTLFNLNTGPGAAQFKRFAPSLTEELIECQRYFEKSYSLEVPVATSATYNGVTVGEYNNNGIDSSIVFKVLKRVDPTVTIYNPGTGAPNQIVGYGGGGYTASQGPTGQSTALVNVTGGPANTLMYCHWAAESEIG